MPYQNQRGDYMGGGYQRGDPGLFGFLGGVAKRIFKGSPVGQITSAVLGGAVGRGARGLPSPGSIGGPAGFQENGMMLPQKIPGPRGQIQRILPYGETGYTCGPNGECPRGQHLNKSGYWTRSGFVAPRTKCVTNRTMNVGNAKALRRSIRREQGFVKLAQRSLKGTGYKIARR